MLRKPPITILALCLLLLCGGLFVPTAHSQSANDLRRENDALAAQVDDLEAELDAARKRIKELENIIRNLRRGGSGGGDLPPAEPEKVTIDESKPNASPRALFRALQENYKEAHGELTMGAENSRERNVYLKAVNRWTQTANRRYREPITWTVLVEDFSTEQRGVQLTLQAIDPATNVFLGEPFPVLVQNRTLLRLLDDLAQRDELIDQKMQLKGVLMPQVTVNADRADAGTFNNPPLIGPFAEFTMTVELTSLQIAEEAEEENSQGK